MPTNSTNTALYFVTDYVYSFMFKLCESFIEKTVKFTFINIPITMELKFTLSIRVFRFLWNLLKFKGKGVVFVFLTIKLLKLASRK